MSPERRELVSDPDRGFLIATQVSDAAALIKSYADTAEDLELAEFAQQFATELRAECMKREREKILAATKPSLSWAEFSARYRSGTSTER
ncbi:hypothetical protein [Nocardia aobensis]|uniref:hypothetical protein n=1 Tax=Nocardia aobensis TaxID=257277 RepID=UPI0002EE723E|nr:hypothetical protein [Nocardia aobensis]